MLQQSNSCAAIWVVLDPHNLAVMLRPASVCLPCGAHEVDQPIQTLVATAFVPDADAAVAAPAAGLGQPLQISMLQR